MCLLRYAEVAAMLMLPLQACTYATVLGLIWRPSTPAGFGALAACLGASYLVQRYVASGFGGRARLTQRAKDELRGRLAIVTGANTGIGFETVRGLLAAGARVVLACRSETRGAKAVAKLRAEFPKADVLLATVDMERQKSVRAFVRSLPQLLGLKTLDDVAVDVLVNNAGHCTFDPNPTEDGLQPTLAVNHVSAFLLTELLLPCIKRGQDGQGGRVVNVGSVAHLNAGRFDFTHSLRSRQHWTFTELDDFRKAYGFTKLCNMMHAEYLAQRHGVKAFSAHPGTVLTEMFRHQPGVNKFMYAINKLGCKTAAEGAQTTLHCIYSPIADDERAPFIPNGAGSDAELVRGGYYVDCRLAEDMRSATSVDPEKLDRFVRWSQDAIVPE